MGKDPAAPNAACVENNIPHSCWPGSHPSHMGYPAWCRGDAETCQPPALGLLPRFAALASPGLAYQGFAAKLVELVLKHRRQPWIGVFSRKKIHFILTPLIPAGASGRGSLLLCSSRSKCSAACYLSQVTIPLTLGFATQGKDGWYCVRV